MGAGQQKEIPITVQFRGSSLKVKLAESSTLEQLAREIKEEHIKDIDLQTVKFLSKGHKLQLADTLAAAGVKPGGKLQLMASTTASVDSVRQAKDLPGMAGFDHELQREQRRQVSAATRPARLPAGPYTFQRFEPWQQPGLVPPPAEALKLLEKLASDPGIVGVMKLHRWSVGLLSEMPPQGKVGVSPVCILGVNVNHGQEISLRLRTDDLQGFRRYDRIRETAIHELAHMVYSEHDNNFKELNSKLKREADALDWRGAPAARSVGAAAAAAGAGGAPSLGAPAVGGTPAGAMAATATSSGKTLREIAGEEVTSGGAADARAAAAAAALRRAGEAGPRSHPVSTAAAAAPTPEAHSAPRKGDAVEYRQRDGTWVAAKVVAVDMSVIPPSFGIEIDGAYRETEGDRLRDRLQAPVEGLGHFDAVTEAKEEEMRSLER